ncbi:MAG: hypothetical protein QW041_01120 [Candidatus Pacearchaeota archaeon]
MAIKEKKHVLIIFILFLALFSLLTETKVTSWNDEARMATIESIVERNTLAIDNSIFNGTGDKYFYNGHFYSDKPPLLSIYSSILYFGLKLFGITFSKHYAMTYYLLTLLTVGVISALGLVYFYKSLRLMKVDEKWSKILTFIAGTGTLILPYSTVYNNHVISGALLMISFYFLLKLKNLKHVIIAGFLMSLAGSIDTVTFLFIPFAFFIVFRKENIKSKITFILAAIPLTIIFFLINYYTSGSIIPPSINEELHNYVGSYMNKNTMCGLAMHNNVKDLLIYAFHMIFGNRGFFSYTPILLFSVYALAINFKRKDYYTKYYLYILLSSLMFIIFYIIRTTNYSGNSFGVRWFATIILLCLLPLGRISKDIEKSKIKKGLFILLAVLSMIISLIGTVNAFTIIGNNQNSLINCINFLIRKDIVYKIKLLGISVIIFYGFYKLLKNLMNQSINKTKV